MPSPPVPATPSSYVLPSNFELGGTRRQSTNRQECSPHDFTPDEKETEKREIFTNSCLLGAFVTARIDNHQYKRVSFPLLVLSNSTALSPHPHTHTHYPGSAVTILGMLLIVCCTHTVLGDLQSSFSSSRITLHSLSDPSNQVVTPSQPPHSPIPLPFFPPPNPTSMLENRSILALF
jgi:hypothetical protein